ncbi:DNA polymerase Y family protein [Galbitalea sp. SE-J8]|uniref:DNA polymerase Y family protein n=1 Tax=Galbitalea sp. SE-J8 TaxID=3054952 RepID=UPI00259CD077|nr:DNA polymerase Y family protein [Galbitalea sp. SE-J8]MDM4763159.1 DNA polymerase Y family protein [Galbitalea sp. SE-J8]
MSPRASKAHRAPRPRIGDAGGSVTAQPETATRLRAADVGTTRTIVLWSPDWPISALARSTGIDVGERIALIASGAVFACSASARAQGVRRAMRVRDAQARCPDLLVREYEPSLDARAFEPVLTAIEALTPGVQVLRPGMVAVRERGPARYYGGELAAGIALAGVLDDLGIRDTRVGIADGPFAAEQAARRADGRRPVVVPADGSTAFLAGLPVAAIGDADLVALLRRLGIATLGGFAALAPTDVRDRFGESAAWLHALAAGADARPVRARTPPPELAVRLDLEPPLDRVDQIAFAVRASADRFVTALVAARLVCTALRVEVETENGEYAERTWLHPRSFSPADVVDRVRWQLQGAGEDAGLGSGVVRIRLVPETVDPIGQHEQGLWGGGPDERVHRGMTRVQSMLGHGGVLQAVVGGGRSVADRQVLVPWGDPTDEAPDLAVRPPARPWPGRLPDPAPATVFAVRHPVSVFAADGALVAIDDRGALSAPPARMATGSRVRALTAWAGPWPVDERWWDAAAARRAHRFQVVDDAGSAWLLVLEMPRRADTTAAPEWFLEGRYD